MAGAQALAEALVERNEQEQVVEVERQDDGGRCVVVAVEAEN
jgi:hypothetical protein